MINQNILLKAPHLSDMSGDQLYLGLIDFIDTLSDVEKKDVVEMLAWDGIPQEVLDACLLTDDIKLCRNMYDFYRLRVTGYRLNLDFNYTAHAHSVVGDAIVEYFETFPDALTAKFLHFFNIEQVNRFFNVLKNQKVDKRQVEMFFSDMDPETTVAYGVRFLQKFPETPWGEHIYALLLQYENLENIDRIFEIVDIKDILSTWSFNDTVRFWQKRLLHTEKGFDYVYRCQEADTIPENFNLTNITSVFYDELRKSEVSNAINSHKTIAYHPSFLCFWLSAHVRMMKSDRITDDNKIVCQDIMRRRLTFMGCPNDIVLTAMNAEEFKTSSYYTNDKFWKKMLFREEKVRVIKALLGDTTTLNEEEKGIIVMLNNCKSDDIIMTVFEKADVILASLERQQQDTPLLESYDLL